ncbi:unnamed protein product, partial [Prunus brigantina]
YFRDIFVGPTSHCISLMKNKAMQWKTLAEEVTGPHDSSSTNLDNLANEMQLRKI